MFSCKTFLNYVSKEIKGYSIKNIIDLIRYYYHLWEPIDWGGKGIFAFRLSGDLFIQ